MTRKSLLVALSAAFIALAALAGPAGAIEFSADTITTMGGQTIPGKLYVKGQSMRMEGGPTAGIVIRNAETGKVFIVMPQNNMYMESPDQTADDGGMDVVSPESDARQGIKRTKIGTETVNGYKCDKYKITFDNPDKGQGGTQWVSRKHKLPIKSDFMTAMGPMVMEMKNIKMGGVSDSMFNPPAGMKKMDLGAMGNQMKKMADSMKQLDQYKKQSSD